MGIEGTIEIDSLDADVSGGLIVFSASFLDASAQLADRCAARVGLASSSLTGVGRGGLPLAPEGAMPIFYLASTAAGSVGPAPAAGIIPGNLVLACTQ